MREPHRANRKEEAVRNPHTHPVDGEQERVQELWAKAFIGDQHDTPAGFPQGARIGEFRESWREFHEVAL